MVIASGANSTTPDQERRLLHLTYSFGQDAGRRLIEDGLYSGLGRGGQLRTVFGTGLARHRFLLRAAFAALRFAVALG